MNRMSSFKEIFQLYLIIIKLIHCIWNLYFKLNTRSIEKTIWYLVEVHPRNLSASAWSTLWLPELPFPSNLLPLYGQSWIVATFSPQQTALQMSVNTGTVSLSPVFKLSVTHWVYNYFIITYNYFIITYMKYFICCTLFISLNSGTISIVWTSIFQQKSNSSKIFHLTKCNF